MSHISGVCIQSLSSVWLFWDPMDYSPPCSSAHRIFQARILEWVAISFSGGSSQLRDQIHDCVSYFGRWIFYHLTEESGGQQSTGSQRVRRDWVTNTFTFSTTWNILGKWSHTVFIFLTGLFYSAIVSKFHLCCSICQNFIFKAE